MEEQPDNIFQKAEQPKRPQLLTALCILSFIGSGMSGFSFFMVYSAYDDFLPQLQEFAGTFPGMEFIIKAPKNFFLAGFMLYSFSFFGVNLLWRLKKVGFHFYAGAQVALLLLPVIYIKDYPLPFLDGLLTALFVILYFRHYKIFK